MKSGTVRGGEVTRRDRVGEVWPTVGRPTYGSRMALPRALGDAAPQQRLNASFDDVPDAYDQLRTSGHMARRRAEYFEGVVAESSGLVLELGCGTGPLLRHLAARFPQRTFVGVEPLTTYVEFARRRAAEAHLTNVRFEVGLAEDIAAVAGPVPAGLVISVDMLHHVRDMGKVAREALKVTAAGGRWRAQEPNAVHPYVWLYHTLTAGERTFPVRSFLDVARGAGWQPAGRECMYLFPSGVAKVPGWAERLERRAERLRPIAGGVVLDLLRP
jgi:ubiquinone/menaquinone biosynthesis C-methylase UbiE